MSDCLKTVCVLVSVYNGEKYLKEQLEALRAQESVSVKIFVRDDGSTDGSISLLNKWQKDGLLTWYSGPNLGPARSFLNLLSNAPSADYYAFCDQDDIWLPDKLIVAISSINSFVCPSMYCSAYQMVDASLNPIKTSNDEHHLTFPQALVTNYTTGCTVVMNAELANAIKTHNPEFVMMHDSWVVKSCLAIGGAAIYDETPHILYRQHGDNVVGGQADKWKKLYRRWHSFINPQRLRYKEAMSLFTFSQSLTEDNARLLHEIEEYYNKPLLKRMRLSKMFVSGDLSRDRLVRWSFVLKQF